MLPPVASFLCFLGVLAFLASDGAVLAQITNSARGAIGGWKCDKDCISISQAQTGTKGIPIYSVEVINGCDKCVSNIHLNCANFHYASVIGENFKRIGNSNECLLNNGAPLAAGKLTRFEYLTSYQYHFTVSSVVCHHLHKC